MTIGNISALSTFYVVKNLSSDVIIGLDAISRFKLAINSSLSVTQDNVQIAAAKVVCQKVEQKCEPIKVNGQLDGKQWDRLQTTKKIAAYPQIKCNAIKIETIGNIAQRLLRQDMSLSCKMTAASASQSNVPNQNKPFVSSLLGQFYRDEKQIQKTFTEQKAIIIQTESKDERVVHQKLTLSPIRTIASHETRLELNHQQNLQQNRYDSVKAKNNSDQNNLYSANNNNGEDQIHQQSFTPPGHGLHLVHLECSQSSHRNNRTEHKNRVPSLNFQQWSDRRQLQVSESSEYRVKIKYNVGGVVIIEKDKPFSLKEHANWKKFGFRTLGTSSCH